MRTGKRTVLGAFLLFQALFLSGALTAQNMPIGGWRMHLPYKSCKYVTGSTRSVWAATDDGLFRLNRADYSLERITKIEGLSDLSIGAINYNPATNTLLVGYKNGNIDIIRDKQITNLPDIKRAQIIGNKDIHNFYFVGNLAYVSTGFGIVVIDIDRNEVKDTYFIGPNGNNLEVFDLVSDGTTLFAGTAAGIYYAPINDPFIANFATWHVFTTIPANLNVNAYGDYTNINIAGNKLLAGYFTAYPVPTGPGKMLTYDFSTSAWDTVALAPEYYYDIVVTSSHIYFDGLYNEYVFDLNLGNMTTVNALDYTPGHAFQARQLFVDETETLWLADIKFGLVKTAGFVGGTNYYPNGPITTNAYWMDVRNSEVLTVPGGHDDAWNNVFNKEGNSVLSGNSWSVYDRSTMNVLDTMYDFISCAIDPNDADHYWLGSWGTGLLEINNGAVVNLWNEQNSTLYRKVEYHWVGVGGLAYDDAGNLWVTNSHVMTALNVYKTNGTWQAYDFTGYIPIGMTVSELMITKSGQKWMILPRGSGMLVFDDNGTLSNTADDKKRRLGFTAGSGGIPGTDVYCMAEDQDGEIWIGTDKGIGVFYCADNIFNSGGCDAQQILITQDGHVQILLETQVVTCIAVDGANRKWIGTESGGVFLMSADGTQQLAHFDASNSPLLSDNITSLVIDQKTGEVFFGTSKGIVSYRGEAIEGGDEMGDVYAFPNPVYPSYSGPIAITGLVNNADVKITDISGHVVFKTTALGGQAIWDGNNFQGERAASGVYLVMITNEDGTQKAITKILLMN
jgi:hypothetical protein